MDEVKAAAGVSYDQVHCALTRTIFLSTTKMGRHIILYDTSESTYITDMAVRLVRTKYHVLKFVNISVEFNPLFYIISKTDKRRPSTTTNLISLVNTCYMLRSY